MEVGRKGKWGPDLDEFGRQGRAEDEGQGALQLADRSEVVADPGLGKSALDAALQGVGLEGDVGGRDQARAGGVADGGFVEEAMVVKNAGDFGANHFVEGADFAAQRGERAAADVAAAGAAVFLGFQDELGIALEALQGRGFWGKDAFEPGEGPAPGGLNSR